MLKLWILSLFTLTLFSCSESNPRRGGKTGSKPPERGLDQITSEPTYKELLNYLSKGADEAGLVLPEEGQGISHLITLNSVKSESFKLKKADVDASQFDIDMAFGNLEIIECEFSYRQYQVEEKVTDVDKVDREVELEVKVKAVFDGYQGPPIAEREKVCDHYKEEHSLLETDKEDVSLDKNFEKLKDFLAHELVAVATACQLGGGLRMGTCQAISPKIFRLVDRVYTTEDLFLDAIIEVQMNDKVYPVSYFIGLNTVFSSVAPGLFRFEGGPLVGQSDFAQKYQSINSTFIPQMK